MTKENTSKVAVIRDLEFHWANVYNSHSPFGTDIWDIQIRTTDENKVKELAELGINLKTHDEGYFFGNVKRKTMNAKGEPMSPPLVLNAAREPMTDAIGNGSTGNIKVFSYDYKVGGRSGRAAMLTAIQVADLVPYKMSSQEDDFDVLSDEASF